MFRLGVLFTMLFAGALSAAQLHSDADELRSLERYLREGMGRSDERIEYLPFGSGKRPIVISTPRINRYDADDNALPVVVVLDNRVDYVRGVGLADSIPPIIIGVPSDNRVRDFIAPRPLEGDWADPEGRQSAPDPEAFMNFLAQTLSPYIDRRFPKAPVKILAGYSFGGIAAIHCLMRHPQAFDAYIAASPSLWYNTDFYLELAKQAARRPHAFKRKCLVLTAAEDEAPILTNTRRFERLLTQLNLPLQVYFKRTLDQDHSHHGMSSMEFGWEVIFQLDDSFPMQSLAELNRRQLRQRILDFEEERSCVRFTPTMTAQVWLAWGSQLVEEGRYEEARRLFERLVQDLPDVVKPQLLRRFPGVHFTKLPEDFQEAIAAEYWRLYRLAQRLAAPFAVHYRQTEIVDYLNARD